MKIFDINNSKFRSLLSKLPPLDLAHGPWVAGGSVRKVYQGLSWEKGDIDVFFANNAQRTSWRKEFAQNLDVHMFRSSVQILETTPVSDWAQHYMSTDNAETWRLCSPTLDIDGDQTTLQFIKSRYADSVEALWDSFDLSVTEFATDGRYIVASNRAIEDVNLNQITLTNPNNTKTLALRVFKYITHGFNASDELILQAANQLAEDGVTWDDQY